MTINTTFLPHRVGMSFSHLLNELLIDEYLLYTETRICHWHLEEQPATELRSFLQRQYETLDTLVDRVALCMRAEGHSPVLRPRAFQHIRTFLADDTIPAAVTMLKKLMRAHTLVIQRLQKISRSGSTPAGIMILLQELIVQHKQMRCLLKAHLTLCVLQAFLSTHGITSGQQ